MEKTDLEWVDVFPNWKNGGYSDCYVSLPEGTPPKFNVEPENGGFQ